MADWVQAQNVVFRNCGEDQLSVPPPPAASADALEKADREYQTAAAYFYNGRFDEAAARFRAVAANSSSPWRPYGRYLAARAAIRRMSLAESGGPQLIASASATVADLRAVLADPAARTLHASAGGLIDLVTLRADPVRRLRELTAALAAPSGATNQQVIDFRMLMDRFIGADAVEFDYASLSDRAALAATPMADWILAMQGTGPAAVERTLQQWKATGSAPWLIAALWKVPARSPDMVRVLEAAARVEATSPAFPTVAFLRASVLAQRGEREAARALLTALPTEPTAAFPSDSVNLLDALRFSLADSLEELLDHAPRRAHVGSMGEDADLKPEQPIFDTDASTVFTFHLPVASLVRAAQSEALPERLRRRVAMAAFARAVLLARYDEALAVAPILERSSPALASDVAEFRNAAAADRHLAAVRLLIRTPGMHAAVRGLEDESTYGRDEPHREQVHRNGANWWCSFTPQPPEEMYRRSAMLPIVYPDGVRPPAFLSAADRASVSAEINSWLRSARRRRGWAKRRSAGRRRDRPTSAPPRRCISSFKVRDGVAGTTPTRQRRGGRSRRCTGCSRTASGRKGRSIGTEPPARLSAPLTSSSRTA